MVSSIIILYIGLFKLIKILKNNNLIWSIAFIVFISPFIYIIIQFNDLLELIWILSLTPFYGITVLLSMFTNWVIIYYNIAFSILAVTCLLFSMKHYRKYLKNSAWTLIIILILIDTIALSFQVNELNYLRNPTSQEALQFIASDQTNSNQYRKEEYTCTNFATDVKNNALRNRYNCGYVIIYFPDGQSHAINCFNTSDNGLIFVEPQTDTIVQLNLGQPYLDKIQYEPQNFNDTIIKYTIIWFTQPNEPLYLRLFLVVVSIGFSDGLFQTWIYSIANITLSNKNKLIKILSKFAADKKPETINSL